MDPLAVLQVFPTPDLVHSILAFVHATSRGEILKANVAGLVQVTKVDMESRRIHYLAPCPGFKPSNYLVLGSFKWMD
jgi:polyribonucleotide 5'-hydroxyl-kinase